MGQDIAPVAIHNIGHDVETVLREPLTLRLFVYGS